MSRGEKNALRRWWAGVMHWLFLTCQQFMRQESERRVRPLTVVERARGLGHRLMCRICRTQVKRLAQLGDLARSLGAARPPSADATDAGGPEPEGAGLSPDARERLRAKLLEAKRGARDDDR